MRASAWCTCATASPTTRCTSRDHYLRREAYVAAIDRARYCIENYDGAPAVRQALEIMIAAYKGMGLDDLAERSQEVFALNYPDAKPVEHDQQVVVAGLGDGHLCRFATKVTVPSSFHDSPGL